MKKIDSCAHQVEEPHTHCEHKKEHPKHSFLKKNPTRRVPLNPSSSRSKNNCYQQSFSSQTSQISKRAIAITNQKQAVNPHCHQGVKIQSKCCLQTGKQNEDNNKMTFGSFENCSLQHSFLRKEDFQISPTLYWLWRTQSFVNEVKGSSFELRNFSKGRKEIRYSDGTVQVLYEDLKLTRWNSGDFKLVEGEKVSFWSQELQQLDFYFIY